MDSWIVNFFMFQALLRGAVSQQSAVILVCMAIDRYLYLLHPNTYHKHSSKKVCKKHSAYNINSVKALPSGQIINLLKTFILIHPYPNSTFTLKIPFKRVRVSTLIEY